MDQRLICRTCLKTNLLQDNYRNISAKAVASEMTIKEMLEIFMPEMELDIFEDELVVCLSCSQTLEIAYIFKSNCLKIEDKIYEYLHHNNLNLEKKIKLQDIVDNQISSNDGEAQETTKLLTETENSCTIDSVDLCTTSESEISEIESEIKDEGLKTPSQRAKRSKLESCRKTDYNSLKRSYTCDQCEYKSYREDLLERHKDKHHLNILNDKEYKCDYCMYSTFRKRALDRHLFTHKGASPHICKICNKSFAENYQLKLHFLTHSPEDLPHKCENCEQRFLTKSYLKQHMEVRHLAKDFKCTECPTDQCQHQFIRWYRCYKCEVSFSDKRGLEAHEFTHSEIDFPYKCSHCRFQTAWKNSLNRHLKNKH